MEEMKHNVDTLLRMSGQMEAARNELEAINKEESLLDWEETSFPQLQQMFQAKEPYDKLWINALNFTVKSEEWMNGWQCLHLLSFLMDGFHAYGGNSEKFRC